MANHSEESWSIKTARLLLRDFKEKDLDEFVQYRSDPILCQYQDFMVKSQIQAKEFYISQKNITLGSVNDWKQIAIANKSDVLIGDCAFKCNEDEKRLAEIGITIRKEYHNQGIAYEALDALITYAFEKLVIHKIIAIIDVRNTASQKLLIKLNFMKEAHFIKHYWDKNLKDWFDEYHYGILKENHLKK